jgi:hypothetical protein
MTGSAPPSSNLLALLDGYRALQVLYVAAELGIADSLKDGPKSSVELAHASGAHAQSLHRLLRALASLAVIEERADGTFSLTPLGKHLRSDVPGSLRPAFIFYGGRRHWTAWGQLLDSIKSGKTAFGNQSPDMFIEMAARNPEGARIFNEAMAALSGLVSESVITVYDFSDCGTLVDVGGGYGALLISVLLANPRLRGVLFDIAPVIEGARARIEAAGLTERCALVAGNAFETVPTGGDVYLLKWVLHDWNDEMCTSILTNCRAAMDDDGTLLLVERVVPHRVTPSPQAAHTLLSDLNMLLLSSGRERTEDEYRLLLAAAGFDLRRILQTTTPQCIIEARPCR